MKRIGLFKKLKYLLELNKLTKDKTMIAKLKSRKLWAAILGAALLSLGDAVGLTPELTQGIVTIITGYIIGQGIADAGAGGGSQGN